MSRGPEWPEGPGVGSAIFTGASEKDGKDRERGEKKKKKRFQLKFDVAGPG
jgi:hypothetical protein